MQTSPITSEDLRRSVIAVPPLARRSNGDLSRGENRKIIRHIESGGVTTLLYGGNANFYHIPLRQYKQALGLLAKEAGANTIVVPSVGPAFGTMLDQLTILREYDFPTAMMLPMQGITTDCGVASGFRSFVQAYGKPGVLYIKSDGYIEPETVAKLVNEGLVSWIKYATVREQTEQDSYLSKLVELVDPKMIVSGIGEQPAIVHLRDFGLAGFTTGCGCVAPRLSMAMLNALQSGDYGAAENIRQTFCPLEDHRNSINPIRVLHDAVTVSGIADCGPALPLLANLTQSEVDLIRPSVEELKARDNV